VKFVNAIADRLLVSKADPPDLDAGLGLHVGHVLVVNV
jgi:hypothetical protein